MTAILAALLGASVTGFITHRLTRHREREEAPRKKVGLLKLVHAEVTNNLQHLKAMESNESPLYEERVQSHRDRAAALKSGAWEQSRASLAALVEDERRFEYLVSCNESLSVLRDRLLHPSMDDFTQQEHEAQVVSVRRHHWLAFEACRVETKRFRTWSKGMLVSEHDDRPSQLEDQSEDETRNLTQPD